MKLIIVNAKGYHTRTVQLKRSWLAALSVLFVTVPVILGATGYFFVSQFNDSVLDSSVALRWEAQLTEQKQQLASVNDQAEVQLNALTARLGALQAQLLRLDALGERLLEVAGVDSDEFDFNLAPAVGGPEPLDVDASFAYQPPSFSGALDELDQTLATREQQLRILESLLDSRRAVADTAVAGRPITKGWLSSRYGQRTDPFTGRLTMHKGVDFAAKDGSDVLATGAGLVTYAGNRWGYGNLVEINHGNGLATRYAHLKEVVAQKGDIVKANDRIGIVGSTGRSTGPHVHYEVLRNGHQVNPATYIAKARQ